MKIEKPLYQTIILVLPLLYVNFFVFSPFFHHHHPEKELVGVQSVITYSPLINECCELDCDESSEDHLEDCSDNSHNLEACNINNVFMIKNYEPNLKIDSYSSFGYVINDDHKTKIKNPTHEDFFHLHWEKFVNSATNVSPPTA